MVHTNFSESGSVGSKCVTYMPFPMTYDFVEKSTVMARRMQCPRGPPRTRKYTSWPAVDMLVKRDGPMQCSITGLHASTVQKGACGGMNQGWLGLRARPCPSGGSFELCARQMNEEMPPVVSGQIDYGVLQPNMHLALCCDDGTECPEWSCSQHPQGLPDEKEPGDQQCGRDGVECNGEHDEPDDLWLMQRGKGKDNKRRRSPTPRRRRIPARPRQRMEPSQRQHRRASWARTPTRPTCSQSWVEVPWRRHGGARSQSSRAPEPEPDGEEEPAINLTATSSAPAVAPPLPPFEEGIRTWGELIGILDPMDKPESVIDPLVVENGVDRIRRMGSEERGQLAVQLVRFLAILYAEILRMLQMAEQDQGEETSLLQMSGEGSPPQQGSRTAMAKYQGEDNAMNEVDDVVQFMQTFPDKFGPILQKLIGLLEKMSQSTAATRANFLRSMLTDVQRPGLHISAAVIDRMDRLQALLLSFDEGEAKDTTDEDREWCFRQWEVVKPILLDKRQETVANAQETSEQARSSTDIVCLEDSQEPNEDNGYQVVVLPDGAKRPLTQKEVEEVAYHEELEASAADREARADEHRWLEYRAQCLREEEEADMREALEESATEHVDKKARVLVQVEGEGGRVVRSEVFNMVVKEGEVLTYKIMVLPRDDPEVRALRRQQASRDRSAPADEQASDESDRSAASAETLPTDEVGRLLPEPAAVSNDDLEKFMRTEEGNVYYKKWLKGEITCKMVRERSGCGLLAKFFSKKVEEEEEQKMLQVALQAEREQDKVAHCDTRGGHQDSRPMSEGEENVANDDKGDGRRDQGDEQQVPGVGLDQGCEVPRGSMDARLDQGQSQPRALLDDRMVPNELVPPTVWPSFTLQASNGTINIETQTDSQNSGLDRPNMSLPAATFTSISEEENQRELAFAIAAGDVTPPQQTMPGSGYCGDGPSVVAGDGNMQVDEMDHGQGHEASESEGLRDIEQGVNEVTSAGSTEGTARNESNSGPRQLDLKHWLL